MTDPFDGLHADNDFGHWLSPISRKHWRYGIQKLVYIIYSFVIYSLHCQIESAWTIYLLEAATRFAWPICWSITVYLKGWAVRQLLKTQPHVHSFAVQDQFEKACTKLYYVCVFKAVTKESRSSGSCVLWAVSTSASSSSQHVLIVKSKGWPCYNENFRSWRASISSGEMQFLLSVIVYLPEENTCWQGTEELKLPNMGKWNHLAMLAMAIPPK